MIDKAKRKRWLWQWPRPRAARTDAVAVGYPNSGDRQSGMAHRAGAGRVVVAASARV